MNSKVEQYGDSLYQAERSNTAIPYLPSDDDDLELALSVQQHVTSKKIEDDGEAITGYKIALTNVQVQGWYDANEPVFGTLTTQSLSSGVIDTAQLFKPLIEMELEFLVDEDLDPRADAEDIVGKLRVAPGLEVPDCRFRDWTPAELSLFGLIADNSVTGRVQVGEPISCPSIDALANIEATLSLNEEELGTGSTSAVLDNPLNALIWLMRQLDHIDRRLEKGMVVSSGSILLPVALRTGTYEARLAGMEPLSLTVT